MTHPCLHFAMNEAWILSAANDVLDAARAAIRQTGTLEEKYASGALRMQYSGGAGEDGSFLLNGRETWYYENGVKQYQGDFTFGRKTGEEIYWRPSGSKEWQWHYRPDEWSVWTQWWANGAKKAESSWRNGRCQGTARRWNAAGALISEVDFVDGEIKTEKRAE